MTVGIRLFSAQTPHERRRAVALANGDRVKIIAVGVTIAS
jgi:hypothetical protein